MLLSRHYGSGFVKARTRVFVSGTPESPIPETGNLSTRHLLKSDGPQLLRGFHPGKSRSLVTRTPDLAIPDFPEMGDLTTRGLRQSDGSDLSRGFHHGKSRTLVNRNPDSAIPDFPKWEISRHVASVNRTAQIHPGVFTMENPELLSTGIPIPRFPISRNGRSHDTWPPSIGRLRSIPGFFTPNTLES
jgi:hypothetical protein